MATFGQHWENQAFSAFQGLGTLSDYVEQHWPSLGNNGRFSAMVSRVRSRVDEACEMTTEFDQLWALLGNIGKNRLLRPFRGLERSVTKVEQHWPSLGNYGRISAAASRVQSRVDEACEMTTEFDQLWALLGNLEKNRRFPPFRGLERCVTTLSNIGQVWATMDESQQWFLASDLGWTRLVR